MEERVTVGYKQGVGLCLEERRVTIFLSGMEEPAQKAIGLPL